MRKISLRDRSIATISALMAQGLFPQLKSHFILGKKHGVTKEEQIEIAKAFVKIGKENAIIIHSCCEKTFLAEYGLECNGCMSQEIIERSIDCKLEPPKRKNLRQECNCLMGNDIGAYNTCGHLCKYCYANSNKSLVIENMKKHNEKSPFLIGDNELGDKITVAKQKSWIENEQISFIYG